MLNFIPASKFIYDISNEEIWTFYILYSNNGKFRHYLREGSNNNVSNTKFSLIQ